MQQDPNLPKWAQRLSMVVVYSGLIVWVGLHFDHHGIFRFSQKIKGQACPRLGASVTVTFYADRVDPNPLTVHRCDQVTILNQGRLAIEPAVGPHEHHLQYPGLEEHLISSGESQTFTATAAGTWELHDHERDELVTQFTVQP